MVLRVDERVLLTVGTVIIFVVMIAGAKTGRPASNLTKRSQGTTL